MERLEDRLAPAVVSPGDAGIGALTVTGDFAPAADDTLRIDVLGSGTAGLAYDRLNVQGGGATAKFDGTLDINLLNGFTPALGDTFTVLSYPAYGGTFPTVKLPELSNGLSLVPVFGPTELTLVASKTASGKSPLYAKAGAAAEKLLGFFGSLGVPTSTVVTGVSLTAAGQTVTGDFGIAAAVVGGSPAAVLTAANLSAAFTVGGKEVVTVSNGTGGAILSAAGVALDAAADVAVSAADLSLTSRIRLAVNTGPAANVTANGVSVNLPAGPFFRVEATGAELTIGAQTVAGDFGFEAARATTGKTVVRAAAANVSAFLGSADGTTGVKVSNAGGGLIVRPEGVAAQFGGAVDLVGGPAGLTLGGTAFVGLNTTGLVVNDTFTFSTGQEVRVDFSAFGAARTQQFGGSLNLDVNGFVQVQGGFAFNRSTSKVGTVTTTQVQVGVVIDKAFFGAPASDGNPDGTGLLLTAGKVGLVLNTVKDTANPANNSSTYALAASGAAALVGVDGLTLSGTGSFKKNTTGGPVADVSIPVPGSADPVVVGFADGESPEQVGGTLNLDVGGFVSIQGGFTVERTKTVVGTTTTTAMKVGVAVDRAFFGDPGPTAAADDDTGLLVTDGTFGLILNRVTDSANKANNTTAYALAASGAAAVVGVDGLTLSGTGFFRRNATGAAVPATAVALPGGKAVTLEFTDGSRRDQAGGSLDLDVGGFVSVRGGFAVERATTVSGNKTTTSLTLGVAVERAFVGDPGPNAADPADDTGLLVTGGTFGLLLTKVTDKLTPANNKSTYAMAAGGAFALVGFAADTLTISGSATIKKNATGGPVETVAITVPGTDDPILVGFDPGEAQEQVTGSLDLAVGDLAQVSGAFAASRTTQTVGTKVTTRLLIGARANVFVGTGRDTPEEMGVRVDGAGLGLALYSVRGSAVPADNKSSYALTATTGVVRLVGIDGLTLSGAAGLSVNATGNPVNESITVPGLAGGPATPQAIRFPTGAAVRAFGGSLEVGVGGFAAKGSFGIQSSKDATTSKLLVGATGVSVGFTSGGVGMSLTDGTLGLLLTRPLVGVAPAKYALTAGGTVAVTGLPLSVGGTLGLRVNTTGGPVNQKGLVVPNLDGGTTALPDIVFAGNSPATQFSGTGVSLGVDNVFLVSGDVTVTPGAGTAASTIKIGNPAVAFFQDGQEAVRIGAPAGTFATFSFGGTLNGVAQGFKLVEFKVGGFSLSPNKELPGAAAAKPTVGGTPAAPPDPAVAGRKLGPLTVTNPTVALKGLDIKPADLLGGTAPITATISVGVEKAELAVANSFTAIATNVTGTFGLSATVGFKDGRPSISDVSAAGKWALSIGQFDVSLLGRITVSAQNVAVNPLATDAQDLISFGQVSATLGLPALTATGFARNFAVSGAGTLVAKPGFSVGFQLSPGQAQGAGMPSFLPLTAASGQNFIAVAASWPDLANRPQSFTLTLNAAISTTIGPMTLAGSVRNLVIDSDLAAAGRFPIVAFDAITVRAGGNLFGGGLEGGLVVGLVRLDASGLEIPSGNTTTPVDRRLMYFGVDAALTIPAIGKTQVRLGLTEQGLTSISVFSGVEIPLGQTGLVLTDFRAGVTLNADPLPAVTDPRQLLSPAFVSTFDLTDEQWQAALKRQAVRQLGGGGLGYLLDLDATFAAQFAAAAVSPALADAFLAQQLTVRRGAAISPLGGSNWLVSDGATRLLVQQPTANGPLAVSRLVLTFAPTLLPGPAAGGPVPQEVRDAFAEAGYRLADGATLSAGPTATSWRILDGNRTFNLVLFGTGGSAVYGVTGSGGSLSQQVSGVVRIEAGATVYHRLIPKALLNASADVIITTDGKFVINTSLNFAGGLLRAQALFYADLSGVGSTGQTALLFYSKAPVPSFPGMSVSMWGGFSTGFVTPAGDPTTVAIADGVNLDQTPLQIVISGGAALTLGVPGPNNTPAVDVLTVTVAGDLGIRIATSTTTFDAFANIGISGLVTIPSVANLAAQFVFSSAGVWGAAAVSVGGLTQLRDAGIDLAGTGYFGVNTTGTGRTVGLRRLRPDGSLPGFGSTAPRDTQVLAPNAADIYVAGVAGLKLGGRDGVTVARIQGALALNVSAGSGLKLFAAGTLQVGPQQTADAAGLSFGVSGALFISGQGFAARLDAYYREARFVYRTDFGMSLFLNTTGREQSYVLPDRLVTWLRDNAPSLLRGTTPTGTGGAAILVPAGAPLRSQSDPGQIDPTRTGPAGPYFVFVGTGRLRLVVPFTDVTAASLDGTLFIAVTHESFTLDVNADFRFGPLANARAAGTIFVVYPTATSDTKAFVYLTLAGNLNLGVLTFEGAATLQFNNTGQPQQVPQTNVTVPADAVFAVQVSGRLKILGSFEVSGSFGLRANADAIQVAVNGTLGFFGTSVLTLNGGATIVTGANPGLVLRLNAGVNRFGIPFVFEATAAAVVQFNTRGGGGADLFDVVNGVAVPRGSFRVGLDNARITVLGAFTLQGNATVERVGGVLRVNVGMGFDFLGGIVRLRADGFLSSEGEFAFSIAGEVNLGGGGFGVFGRAAFSISRLDDNGTAPLGNQQFRIAASGEFSLAAKAFGITIVGVGVRIAYNAGEVTITPRVTILGIDFEDTYVFGRLDGPVQPRLATLNTGTRTLRLNVGNDADGTGGGAGRGVARDARNEQYTLTTNPNGDVVVSAFGFSETFSSQSFDTIEAVFTRSDGQTGTDSLDVSAGITKRVRLFFGDGATATVRSAAPGSYYGFGNTGRLTTPYTPDLAADFRDNANLVLTGGVAPTGSQQRPAVTAGAGSVLDFRGSAGGVGATTGGGATVYGTSAADTLRYAGYLGGAGRGVLYYGFDGDDDLASDNPGADRLDGGGGNDTLTAAGGADSLFGGAANDALAARSTGAGAVVDAGPGDDAVEANILASAVNGGAGTNTLSYFLDPSAATTAVLTNGLLAVNGTAAPLTGFGGNTLTFGSGNDTLTVNGTSHPLTINLGNGADTVTVNAAAHPLTLNVGGDQAADAVTVTGTDAPLTISGGGGASTLTVDRTGVSANLSGSLSATQVGGLGLGGISYSGLGNLNIDLGSGADQFAVSNTASGTTTRVTGRGGADLLTVERVSSSTFVYGNGSNGQDAGADTVTLRLPGSGAGSAYSGLGLAAGTLLLDNSQGQDGASWAVADQQVRFNGATLVNAAGASTVRLIGRGAGDNLTLTDTSPLATNVNLTPDRAAVSRSSAPAPFQGRTGGLSAVVESANTSPFGAFSTRIVRSVASADGRFYYAVENHRPFNSQGVVPLDILFLTVYRIDPRTGSMYFDSRVQLYSEGYAANYLSADLHQSGDGRHLFALLPTGSAVILARDATTGRVSVARTVALTGLQQNPQNGSYPGGSRAFFDSYLRGFTTTAVGLADGRLRVFVAAGQQVTVSTVPLVAATYLNRVRVYDINPDTGDVSASGPVLLSGDTSQIQISDMTADPTGRFLYATTNVPGSSGGGSMYVLANLFGSGWTLYHAIGLGVSLNGSVVNPGAEQQFVYGVSLRPGGGMVYTLVSVNVDASQNSAGRRTAVQLQSIRFSGVEGQPLDAQFDINSFLGSRFTSLEAEAFNPDSTFVTGRQMRFAPDGRHAVIPGVLRATDYVVRLNDDGYLPRDGSSPIIWGGQSVSPAATLSNARQGNNQLVTPPVVTAGHIAFGVNQGQNATRFVYSWSTANGTTVGGPQTAATVGTQNRTIYGLTAVASPYYGVLYGVSAEQDALVAIQHTGLGTLTQIGAESGPHLAGASSVAVATLSGTTRWAFVTSPDNGRVLRYAVNGSGSLTANGSFDVPGARLVRASDGYSYLTVNPANPNGPPLLVTDVFVYVAGSTPNRIDVRWASNLGTVGGWSGGTGFGTAADMLADNLDLVVSGSTGVQTFSSASGSLTPTGLLPIPNAGVLAYSRSRSRLFVARPDLGMIEVYDGLGNSRLVQSIPVGGPVSGLTVVESGSGPVLYATLPNGNALAAVVLVDGRWVVTGRQVQGGGVDGLNRPTVAVPYFGWMAVASLGAGTTAGGLALFSQPTVSTTTYRYDFAAMQRLTVNLGGGGNSINVSAPAVNELNLNVGSGPGSVAIAGTRTGSTTSVSFGNAADALDVRTTGGPLTAFGNDGADSFRVAGGALGGRVYTDGGGGFDTLVLDWPAVNPPTPGGSLTTPSSTPLDYWAIDRIVVPAVGVYPSIAPRTIAEGQGVTLGGSATGGVGNLTYAWDVNGDGQFGDATGTGPALTWGQLGGLGITRNGSYPLALLVTDQNGNTGIGRGTLTVTDVAPNLFVARNPATADDAQPVTLTLTATDLGSDRPTQWLVFWGDGTSDRVPAAPHGSATVSHVYSTRVGTGSRQFTIEVRAFDRNVASPAADGSNWYRAADTVVTVNDLLPTTRTIGGDGSVAEDAPYTLTLAGSGPGLAGLAEWVINWGDGTATTAAADATAATHAYATPGRYTVTAFTRSNAGLVAADHTVAVEVTDVAPALSATGPTVVRQGDRYALTLNSGGAGLNGRVTWAVTWGDGTTVTYAPADAGTLTAEHWFAVGPEQTANAISVSATDDSGTYGTAAPTVAATVLPAVARAVPAVAPDLNEAQVGQPGYIPAAAPGQAITLTLWVDQLFGRTVSSYTVDWGDGTVETFTAIPGSLTYTDDNGTPDDPADDTTVTLPNTANQLTVGHTYAVGAAGTGSPVVRGQDYTIRVTARLANDAAGYQTDTAVTVVNPAPNAPPTVPVVVTPAAPVAKTYDAARVGPTDLVTFADLAGGVPVTATVTLTDGTVVAGSIRPGAAAGSFVVSADLPYTAAGSYPTSVTLTRGADAFGPVTVAVSVARRALTVTAADVSKVYGDALTLTGFSPNGLVGGDGVSAVTLTSDGAVGSALVTTYAITPSAATGTGLDNYDITYAAGTLTVTPRALTVTVGQLTKVYGDPVGLDAASLVTTGAGQLVNGDLLTGLTLTSDGAALMATVGEYGVSAADATGLGLSNYAITYVAGTLAVTPRPLSVSAGPVVKGYGSAYVLGLADVSTVGLVNGDALTGVTLGSDGAAATATVAGGPYRILVSAAAGPRLGNYAVTYADGTLTVTARGLTVTGAGAFATVYGTGFTLPTTAFVADGLVNGDAVTAVALTSFGTDPTATVAGGPYRLTPTAAVGIGLGNYALTFVAGGSITVTPRGLTVTANPLTKVYGEAVAFAGTEFTTQGLVNGDTVGGLTLVSDGAVVTAGVGAYPVTGSAATGVGLDNYSVTVVAGSLAVTARSLTVTATDVGKTYGEAAALAGTGFVADGLVNGDAVTAVALASAGAAATAGVGVYPLAPSAAAGTGLGNYAITYAAGTLTVAPRGLTITARGLSKTYGDRLAPAGTEFVADGLVNGDAVTAVTLTSDGFAAPAPAGGPYSVVPAAAAGTGLGNSAVTYVAGNLTVDRRGLTVTAADRAKTFGATVTFLGTEFTARGLVNGDAVTAVTLASDGAAATAGVGRFPITPSGAAGRGLGNYAIGYADGTLTVDAPTVAVGPNSLPGGTSGATYSATLTAAGGAGPHAFAVTGGRLPAGLTLANGVLSGTPTEAGSFPVTITATDRDRFTGTREFTLVVGLPTVTVTTAGLPPASVTADYSVQLAAAGGVGVHTWQAVGQLPPGLTLSEAGVLSGRPTVGGRYVVVVRAADRTTGTGPAASADARLVLAVADPVAGRVTGVRLLFGPTANPRVYDLPAGVTTVPWAVSGVELAFDKPMTAAAASLLGLPFGTAIRAVTGGGSTAVRWLFAAPAVGEFDLGLATVGPFAVATTAGTPGLNAGFARGFTVRVGDATGDGRVTSADLALVAAAVRVGYDSRADMDGDGDVDAADLAIVRGRIGQR
jgi:hypothetical protein